jgi:DedD protein
VREIETFEETRDPARGRGVQIVLGVALALACGVFAAGVLVGRKGGPTDPARDPDPLARLDQALAAEEPEAAHTPLTFHRTLIEPESPTVSPSELLALGGHATPEGDPSTTSTADVVHVQRGGELEETPNPRGSPPLGPLAASSAEVDPDTARALAPEGADGPYTLQVASYQDEQEARRTSARLRGAGYHTFITAADIPERGTWFRVRIGPFSSQGEVDRQKRDYEERMRAPAIVVKREEEKRPAYARRPH